MNTLIFLQNIYNYVQTFQNIHSIHSNCKAYIIYLYNPNMKIQNKVSKKWQTSNKLIHDF